MTNYGTIPTSSSSSTTPTNLEFISRAKHRIKHSLSTRRPWSLMFNPRSFSLPRSFRDAISRVSTNLSFFQSNYAIVALLLLFLSLLWYPISLIVFLLLLAAWLFLYFLRDEPLVVLNRTVSDRVVLAVMAVLTLGLLLLTGATVNILVAVLIAAVVVVVHAVARGTDDLYLDQEDVDAPPAAALTSPAS